MFSISRSEERIAMIPFHIQCIIQHNCLTIKPIKNLKVESTINLAWGPIVWCGYRCGTCIIFDLINQIMNYAVAIYENGEDLLMWKSDQVHLNLRLSSQHTSDQIRPHRKSHRWSNFIWFSQTHKVCFYSRSGCFYPKPIYLPKPEPKKPKPDQNPYTRIFERYL